jgi:hypothetical protein
MAADGAQAKAQTRKRGGSPVDRAGILSRLDTIERELEALQAAAKSGGRSVGDVERRQISDLMQMIEQLRAEIIAKRKPR